MECSPIPWSGIASLSQARILERVAISFSKGSSHPRDQTHISCLAGEFFTTEPPGKPNSNSTRFEHSVSSVLCSFTQQTSVEHLLYARPFLGIWQYNMQHAKDVCPRGAHLGSLPGFLVCETGIIIVPAFKNGHEAWMSSDQ